MFRLQGSVVGTGVKKILIIVLSPDVVVLWKRDGYLAFLLQQGALGDDGLKALVAHQVVVVADVAGFFKNKGIYLTLQT